MIQHIKRIKFKLLLYLGILFPVGSFSFPPAPHHVIFGTVRDELGRPLGSGNANVYMETSAGKMVHCDIHERVIPGVNYRLEVPMDSGVTDDLYQPTAMRPRMPFVIRVKIGNQVFLPIEMSGEFSKIGEPGHNTRLDLTLGEDSDGDGLPDAWEKALLSKGQGIKDIMPEGDSDGDGMSNLSEYISGNYAFDKEDGFILKIVEKNKEGTVLEFMGIGGRTYSLYNSNDLNKWEQIDFSIKNHGRNLKFYRAQDVKIVRITVSNVNSADSAKFYKIMVQ